MLDPPSGDAHDAQTDVEVAKRHLGRTYRLEKTYEVAAGKWCVFVFAWRLHTCVPLPRVHHFA